MTNEKMELVNKLKEKIAEINNIVSEFNKDADNPLAVKIYQQDRELRDRQKISELMCLIPKEQKEKVFHQEMCDIDGAFVGFIDIYEKLSTIIPTHFTIVDLGCAYNPQCFYFSEHKKYIAVDISNCVKFQSDNCKIYHKSIENFIKEDTKDLNMDETFAICSFVPDWGGNNIKLARESFKNIFVYYPHGGFNSVISKLKKINNKKNG